MDRIWMVCAIVLMFAISIISYVCPQDARADGGFFEINKEYLKNAKFSSDQKLLEMKVILKPGTDGRWAPNKIKFHVAPKSAKTVECTFGSTIDASPLDCGLVPMSLFAYIESRSYVFKMTKQEGDWLQLSAPFAAEDSLWINKKEYPEINDEDFYSVEVAIRTMPLSKWILNLYGFGIVDANVNYVHIYANPNEQSKVFGSCKSAGGNSKGGLMKTRDMKKGILGEVKGDWASVFCDGSDCYDKDSPDFLYSDEVPAFKKEEERRKMLKKCVRGWVRWRANDGRVLLYPALHISH